MPSPAPSICGSSVSCTISMIKTKKRCSSTLRSVVSLGEHRQGAFLKIHRETLGQWWLLKLACLNNNVFHVNSLNKCLQGRFTTMIDFMDNVQAFIMKLVVWQNQGLKLQYVWTPKRSVSGWRNVTWKHETSCAGTPAFHAEGVSDILAGSECTGLKFQPFSVDVRSLCRRTV